MKFVFKRKYTGLFFVVILLTITVLGFYFVGPNYIDEESLYFLQILTISLLDAILIFMFILGLYRVNYYLYHDRIEIHKSLGKVKTLEYQNIIEITEYPNDTIIFFFGKRPSFKIKYRKGNKITSYRMRVSNHQLLKLVLSNEQKIHFQTNK